MLSGDVWPAEAVSSQAASSPPTDGYVRSASQLLRVRARVQYSIADIDAFLFNIRDPDALVASTADSVLRAMIGARSASVCLGPGRATIAEQATRVLQEKLDGMGGGIAIIAVLLDAIESVDGNSPEQSPDPIADRIEQGITTQADGDRLVAAARARSLEIVAAAEQDRDRRVRESQRLLDEVRAMAPAYARDPDGTRRRLLIELANGLPGGAKQLRQVLAETMSPSRRPAATQPGGGR
jgi:membrane protease subunit HflK